MRIAIHPGEVLKEELDERKMSASALARQMAVPPNRIAQLLAGKRAVTSDTALRLAHCFGTSPLFWMNLQSQHDLSLVRQQRGYEIAQQVKLIG